MVESILEVFNLLLLLPRNLGYMDVPHIPRVVFLLVIEEFLQFSFGLFHLLTNGLLLY